MTSYTLYGAEVSYFTGKARASPDRRGADYEEKPATQEVYKTLILPNVGWPVIPVATMPDGTVVQDTADIMQAVEAREDAVEHVGHAAAQSARDEEQRFALDLAHKEKGVLESRAMLGRRHRAPSATGGGGAAAGSGGGASPAVGSGGGTAATPGAAPAGKVDSVLDKENAGGVCTY